MSGVALTVFHARAGDHNNLAMPGAFAIGAMLSERLGLPPTIIGNPESALNTGWHRELDAAMPALRAMAAHLDAVLGRGCRPVSATSRCTVSLATLPVVLAHRPDACVVWFDAHADLNTPETTTSGYLGGLALSGPAGLWDSGLGRGLALSSVILVGQRDIDPPEQALIDAGAVALLAPGAALAQRLRAAVAGRSVYVHLDCDVLDPGIVPTDYLCEHGLSLADLREACAVLADTEVLGIEIAEFQNAWEDGGEAVSPAALLDAVQPLLQALQRGAADEVFPSH
jgi:arginase family enzyme